MSATIVPAGENQLLVSGKLKFAVIVDLREQTEALLQQMNGKITLSFAEVSAVDNSALSFWMCCQRFAAEHSLSLEAQDVPEEMQQFASLVGLEQLFSR